MRYPFGGDGSSAILDLTTGELLVSATDGVAYTALTGGVATSDVTSDLAGTTFLDHITTDAHGIPNQFYGPDGVKQLAIDFGFEKRFLLDSTLARKNSLDAADVAQEALTAAQGALTDDDLGTPGGPAVLDGSGRLTYAQLPTDIGDGGSGSAVIVNGKQGPNISLTAADVGALSSVDGVSAGSVTGLAPVATAGTYASLTGKPTIPASAADVGAIPTTAKGALSGVASLNSQGQVPATQLPIGTAPGQVAPGDYVPQITMANLPVGVPVDWPPPAQAGQLLPRPAVPAGCRVRWHLATPPPSGAPYALPGDLWANEVTQ